MKKYIPVLIISFIVWNCSAPVKDAVVDEANSKVEAANIEKAERTQHTVNSDGHPIAVWEKSHPEAKEAVLLVHGRTWSALPDFDLQVEGEELSLMDALVNEGYATYAIDLRGYGATPRDSSQWFTPDQAAKDLKVTLEWISQQQSWNNKPHLFGWSMGSSNSQLTAQRYPDLISSLILFGYWVDADQEFEADPEGLTPEYIVNTAEAAASDFLKPGITISQNAIDRYVEEALKADSLKVDWRNLDDYNELDPSKVTVPTLLIQGMDDPIAPTDRQVKLYIRLGSTYKNWVTVEGDHAAFMETAKKPFVKSMVDFMHVVSDNLVGN